MLKIIPSDTGYKVGTMYISVYSSSAITTTILASTPQQGGSCTFDSCNRFRGSTQSNPSTASSLQNGTSITGIVPAGGYNYYSLTTSASLISEIQVIPDRGVAYLYASYATDHPTGQNFEWASTYQGSNGLLLGPGSIGYRSGVLYISVFGKTACNYRLTVSTYSIPKA